MLNLGQLVEFDSNKKEIVKNKNSDMTKQLYFKLNTGLRSDILDEIVNIGVCTKNALRAKPVCTKIRIEPRIYEYKEIV